MRNVILVALLALAGCNSGPACCYSADFSPPSSGYYSGPSVADKFYRMSNELTYSSQPAYYPPPMQPMFRHTACDAWRDTLSCASY